jgi:formyltetrahydrofolate synthetase
MARVKKTATKVDDRGKEIIKALQSFEEAKGLSVEIVCSALEEALVNAYQKSVSDVIYTSNDERALARASVNPVTGEIKLLPGTSASPAFRRIDVDVETGAIKGLF